MTTIKSNLVKRVQHLMGIFVDAIIILNVKKLATQNKQIRTGGWQIMIRKQKQENNSNMRYVGQTSVIKVSSSTLKKSQPISKKYKMN